MPKAPRVVEIVGPAGAGKSTLCQALAHASECIHPGNFPDVRSAAAAPFFVWYGLRLAPSLLRLPERGSRQLTRREFAWLSILNGWPAALRRELKTTNGVILLDQGPVYLLTEVREFGPDYLRHPPAEKTWQALYSRWANTLDTIVWLDAPDTCLMQRIRTRDKDHVVKSEAAETVSEFLSHYRVAYEHTLSLLAAGSPDLRVLRFDTNQETPDQIANQLLASFGLGA
jgi:shikimate kinase